MNPKAPTHPRSTTSPRSIAAERKRAHAVYLRETLGLRYEDIAAARLPCKAHAPVHEPACTACARTPMYANRAGACRAVTEAMRETYPGDKDHRESLRSQQLAHIETVRATLMRRIVDPDAETVDVTRAASALVRLLEREARITGMDAPTKVTITEGLDEQISLELEALGLNMTGPTPLS